MSQPCRTFLMAVLIGVIATSSLTAQVKLPKPPDIYDVELRYRIQAGRNERIVQFTEMQKFLKGLGFKQIVNDESDLDIFDPTAERMIGTIPADNARKLLAEPHIQTVLLAPAGYVVPADANERVKVLLELSGGFTLEKQRLFRGQAKQVLASLGFDDAIAYDHRDFTLLRGTMPAVRVSMLLKDLRGQPSGWFLPLVHESERPELLNSKLPVRLIEVLPETGAPAPVIGQAPLAPITPDQPQVAKLSAELRRYLETGKAGESFRVEVTFLYQPASSDNSWREQIRLANPAVTFEGLHGHVVTLTANGPEPIIAMARLPFVQSIRLPRGAALPKLPVATVEPKENTQQRPIILTSADEAFDVLKATRIDRLHARGMRGTGLRIAIIDTDFSGWQKFVGKELPNSTTYVDMTAERNSAILPEPAVSPPGAVGHGTHCALAARLAAPDADIALIRVANDAPYQIVTAYRFTKGDVFQPESFRNRREELDGDANLVRAERARANDDYRKAFDDFDDDEPARERKRNAKAAIAAVEAKERDITARSNRLLKLERELITLGGTRVVLNQVGWNSGQPLDATSTLSRFLDESMGVGRPNPVINAAKQPQPTLWFQPAGDSRGQSWLGLFRDADGNGIMEFAAPGSPLKPGRWSHELNFLAFRSDQGPDEVDLPAGARLRVSIQWREAHDPEIAESEYRQPIAPLNLMLLRQRDPGAEKVASDELEVIARSEGDPERLVIEREFGVYEQSIDVVLPAPGRYAVRVNGRQPLRIRPGDSYGIREQEIGWELRPRLFLEIVDPATNSKGRVVFGDYQSPYGGVAVPADARSVVAVGAMARDMKPEPFSAIGAGLVSELFIKPDVMTFDQLPKLGDGTGPAQGSALSASLAAGLGTCLLGAGAESANFLRYLRIPPGSIFIAPDDWINKP